MKNGGDRRSDSAADQFDNSKTETKGGNDQTYLARKLLTEQPETFDRLKAGEFRSVRAAAKHCGIVKDKPTKAVSIESPDAAIAGLRKVFSDEAIKNALRSEQADQPAPGVDDEALEALRAELVAKHGGERDGAGRPSQTKEIKTNNVSFDYGLEPDLFTQPQPDPEPPPKPKRQTEHGNRKDYTLSRLKKDEPALFDASSASVGRGCYHVTCYPDRYHVTTGSRMALSNAERQRRYRERAKGSTVRLSFPIGSEAATALEALAVQTGTSKRTALETAILQARPPLPRNENPEHQRLFQRPQPVTSTSTELVAPTLPEQRTVTGDSEVDAALWLREVCQTARDPRLLDLALEAAQRIKTPAKTLEKRYGDWLVKQPGAHPFAVALSSFGIADIERHVETARERIVGYNEGMAAFGSYRSAGMETPAEQMVLRTIGPLPDGYCWDWKREKLTGLFVQSVNPSSLTEVVAELDYWQWLHRIRWRMAQTEGEIEGDDPDEISARRWFVEGLLTTIPPHDTAEVAHVIDAVKGGLIDIGSVDDGGRHAEVFEHLLRSVARLA